MSDDNGIQDVQHRDEPPAAVTSARRGLRHQLRAAVTVEVACAGHLPPLLAEPGGSPQYLLEARSGALGSRAGRAPAPLSTTPEAVADAVVRGLEKGAETIWAPPALRFVKFYFLRLGFLDGVPGLIHIAIGCMNSFHKYAKLIELQQKTR